MLLPVALSMIVRDEENNLPACLDAVAGLVAEIVVADTGSADRTREVARSRGARVVDFPWRDDFAAARNESLRHVTCPWVFWMDADDRLDADNRERLRILFASLGDDHVGFVMQCVSPRDPGGHAASVTEHLRLFRNRPDVRWEGRVHEQIRNAVLRSGGELRPTDVVIHHGGYVDAAVRARKAERNLRLLLMQHAEAPDDPFVLFNIGRSHHVLGRKRDAVPYWRRSLQCSPPDAPYLARLYTVLVEGLYDENRLYEALALCREGLARFADNAELLFHEASLMLETGDAAGAEGRLRRWLTLPLPAETLLQDRHLPSKVRHNLAVAYLQMGRPAEAEGQLRSALASDPEYRVAWQGLGQMWLGQGRLDEADEAARQMMEGATTAVDGLMLRARVAQARGDVPAARSALADAARRAPGNAYLHFLLGQSLAQQPSDRDGAETAFRRALELAPGNAEVLRQLESLRRAP